MLLPAGIRTCRGVAQQQPRSAAAQIAGRVRGGGSNGRSSDAAESQVRHRLDKCPRRDVGRFWAVADGVGRRCLEGVFCVGRQPVVYPGFGIGWRGHAQCDRFRRARVCPNLEPILVRRVILPRPHDGIQTDGCRAWVARRRRRRFIGDVPAPAVCGQRWFRHRARFKGRREGVPTIGYEQSLVRVARSVTRHIRHGVHLPAQPVLACGQRQG